MILSPNMIKPIFRALKLAASNSALQEELQEAQMTNSRLHDDIHQLVASKKETEKQLKKTQEELLKMLQVRLLSILSLV